MKEEIHKDFGRDDRNFHPEEQRIIWETMENKEPAIEGLLGYGLAAIDSEKDNYHDQTDNEEDSDNKNGKDQDVQLDKELKDYSDQDFDKKDKSDL